MTVLICISYYHLYCPLYTRLYIVYNGKIPERWTDKPPLTLLNYVTEFIKTAFSEGPETPFDQITLPAAKKDDWAKLIVIDGKYLTHDRRFNQDKNLLLLSDMYEVLRVSNLALGKFASETRTLRTEIASLKKKNQELSKAEGSGMDLKVIIQKELSEFKTDLKKELNEQLTNSMTGTEKKWSDLFKSNQQEIKNQTKQANVQRKEIEKTIAANNRQATVDNLERQKRASNVCINLVPESTKTDKSEQEKEDRAMVIDILNLDDDNVKHVFRAGPVQDKPRSIIAVLSSPDLAKKLHDYGKGKPIRDSDGKNILYWVNPDLIKANRFAKYKARLGKSKKNPENVKVVKLSFFELSQEEQDGIFLANILKADQAAAT